MSGGVLRHYQLGEPVVVYDYRLASGARAFVVCRFEPKDFRPAQKKNGRWVWNLQDAPRLLYRLPEVERALAEGETVWITDGEKDADALAGAGVCATCCARAQGWTTEHSDQLTGARRVRIVVDRDDGVGAKQARQVAESLVAAGAVASVDIEFVQAAAGKDAADHLAAGLSPDQFEFITSAEPGGDEAPEVPPVELDALLEMVLGYLRRWLVLEPAELVALMLWVVHTHAFEAAECTPYIAISSPLPASGKTRTLEALELVVARGWLTSDVSPAVLFRTIEARTPTLLLDESDATFKGDKERAEALRGVLNSGYRLGGTTTRCEPPNWEPREFSTFCPKAFAGLERLPDTLANRSIPIRLRRKRNDEKVERFRRRNVVPEANELRARAAASVSLHLDALRDARPELPDQLGDRAADVWEPLLAIADLAGGDWPDQARAAALALSASADPDEDVLGLKLLADVRAAYVRGSTDRLATRELIRELSDDDEGPWTDYRGKNRRISPAELAALLHPFRIRSRTIWLADGDTPKGFLREQFEDAWARYLPAAPPAPSPSEPPGPPAPAPTAAPGGREQPQGEPHLAAATSLQAPPEQPRLADLAAPAGEEGSQAAPEPPPDATEREVASRRPHPRQAATANPPTPDDSQPSEDEPAAARPSAPSPATHLPEPHTDEGDDADNPPRPSAAVSSAPRAPGPLLPGAADAVRAAHHDGATPQQIAEAFSLPLATVQQILAWEARAAQEPPA